MRVKVHGIILTGREFENVLLSTSRGKVCARHGQARRRVGILDQVVDSCLVLATFAF